MNQKAAISKELNAKHTKILEGLLKLPENRECADCKNKAPRWASINLGIFICLQCSGIHRSLGVHISKVRSATLDTWLPEQVAYMQRVGNEKSNAYWEAELPLHYDKSRFENFIREKYVDRRWVPKDGKVKSPPSSEDGLASPHSSKSESSCSITEFLANQKIIKEYPQVEKETCLKTELTSVDQSLTSMSSNSITDLATDTGNPEVHKKGSEDQTTQVASKDSQMTEQSVLKDQSVAAAAAAAATAVPVEKPSKVDYATELFRMLCVDDSAESDSSPSSSTSAWVDFDSDEEETIQEKNVKRSSDNKVHPEPKIGDVRTSMVPETKEFPQEHQKDATSHNQGLVQGPNTTSGISYHGTTASLQGIHQQPVTTSQAPYLNGRMTNTINQSPGTHLQMLNIPPGKFAASTVPYTTSSLYRPAVAVNGLSTTNPAKTPPAALPVSGYDYDFSFLTQGMFTK